jgi:hypothetical protein
MSRISSILFHGSSSFESFGVSFNSLILSSRTTASFYQSNVALFGQNLGVRSDFLYILADEDGEIVQTVIVKQSHVAREVALAEVKEKQRVPVEQIGALRHAVGI